MGGNWLTTNPRAEQDVMAEKDRSSNGLLFDTCRHIRYVRDNNYSSYHLSGIVIDSFAYEAIGGWSWTKEGESGSAALGEYEKHLQTHLNNNLIWDSVYYLHAPGSNMNVDTGSSIELRSGETNCNLLYMKFIKSILKPIERAMNGRK